MSMWTGLYRGKCTNNSDPEGLNRIKAVIPQVYADPAVESDWAWPCFPPGTDIITPSPGDGVWMAFEGGDNDYPIWMGVWQ